MSSKMVSFIKIILILNFSILLVQSDKQWLCKHPAVYTIDRFNSNTVRIFHENYYIDLNGFPNATTVGAKQTLPSHEFLFPLRRSAKIVTILEGADRIRNRIVKFDGIFWWSWYTHPAFGVRYVATSVGLYWDEIPKMGFQAVFHNGDPKDPMLIGLEANPRYSDKHMKIHYFSTENETFFRKSSRYFDEKDFPIDMTDAFWWPSNDSKYSVYIFRTDRYCRLTDSSKCLFWIPNTYLFGCQKNTKDGLIESIDNDCPKVNSNHFILVLSVFIFIFK